VNDEADDVDGADPAPGTELLAAGRSPPSSVCPACSAPRPTEGRFCEQCGSDVDVAVTPARGGWIAEVITDGQLYERTAPDGLILPEGRGAVTVVVADAEVAIGRRNESRGIEPAIDLSGPLADPAASHRHAVLSRLEDGSYAVTDIGSTNGTTLNDGQVTLEPGQPHPLVDGDRIHIGAWTTITVRRRP
jgi:pSer/pThr/pTyr-binding forkhead associated (FHA) protein